MNKIALKRRGAQAVVTAVLIGLAGCQSTGPHVPASPGGGSSAPATAAERQLQEDQDRVTSTTFAAVLTGAAAGAALCGLGALLTGNKKNAGKAAAICGVGGAVLVGVDGYLTAKKEQAGRQNIRMTQAATADIQQDNKNLQSYLDSSNRVLAEGRARLATLKQDVAAKKMSAEDARRAREREERNIASMSTTLAEAKKTRQQYADASARIRQQPRENTASLDNEIRRMDDQIRNLEQNVSAYRQALEVSRA